MTISCQRPIGAGGQPAAALSRSLPLLAAAGLLAAAALFVFALLPGAAAADKSDALRWDLVLPVAEWSAVPSRPLHIYTEDGIVLVHRFPAVASTVPLEYTPGVAVIPDPLAAPADYIGVCVALAKAGFSAFLLPWQAGADGQPDPAASARQFTAVMGKLTYSALSDQLRVMVLGYGAGGGMAIMLAEQIPDIAGVVAYYPVVDAPAWLAANPAASPLRTLAESNADWQQWLNPAQGAASLKVPLLIHHGDADPWVPSAPAAEFAAAVAAAAGYPEGNPGAVANVVAGGGHYFDLRDRAAAKAAWAKTVSFFQTVPRLEKSRTRTITVDPDDLPQDQSQGQELPAGNFVPMTGGQ